MSNLLQGEAEASRSTNTDPQMASSPEEFQPLNAGSLEYLKNKYGLELKIRSNSVPVDELLRNLEAGALDRGHDRTSPTYDRDFDKSGE
jgi:hypothetical protein